MDKEIFKQRVFEKYEDSLNLIQDDFYNNHFYKEKKKGFVFFRKISTSTIIPIIATIGTVYAGVAAVNYFQQKTKTDFENNVNYDYLQDMKYEDKIYSKVLNSYEEYDKSKEKWKNLVSMTSQDFNEYFVLVIAVENTSLIGLEVSNITCDTNNMYVELYQSDQNVNFEENVISVKIPREQLRENIKFKITGRQVKSDKYIPLKEIPKNYSKEQAIKDNCFVIDNNNVISSDSNQLINFAENINEKFIRIVDFEKETTITDIEFKDDKYYINILLLETGDITYKNCTTIKVLRLKGESNYRVHTQDEYNHQYTICRVNY